MNLSIQKPFNEEFNQVNQTLLLAALYSIMPLGIFLNITQFIVYLRKKFTESTMSIFCIAISTNNILVLITVFLRFIAAIKIYDYEENTYIGCKLASFCIRVVFHACTWLNFLLTLDRLVYILYPNRFTFFQLKINVIKLIILMYTLLFCLNSPSFFIDSSIVQINSSNATELSYICTASPQLSITRELFAQFFGIFVPFSLIFVSNAVLIIKVMNSRKKISSTRDMNFAFTLVISNIVFLVTFLPLSAFLFALMFIIVNPAITSNPEIMSYFGLFETCAFIIACYDYSFGLIVQLYFNKLFRREFLMMVNELYGILNKNRQASLTFSSN
ncbi:unnamed protein product [Brachionus calyciflorus]|uniref:G-protein coupled receptors family 1 profile domain-containing protein n=1 Tax=Brachionus calyciflorus TaxID=104777 RepID=A0A813M7B7_9BILA|nr:unnamed protein product [Brachionus calyciflorus]